MSPEPKLNSLAATPDRIGDYELVRLIEDDDFASIWEARKNGPVRLIQLNEELADDQDLETAFVQHAEAMETVDHPGTLRVLDSATEGGKSFMVTECGEGATLAELMLASSDGRLPAPIVHRVMLETCEALLALHALPGVSGAIQLIHGDLTPHALFVSAEGDVVLAPTCLGGVSCRAPHGQRSGRLSYKAPEQLAQAADPDGRADVFALGATAWHALLGAPPFQASTAAELVERVRAGTPKKLPLLESSAAGSLLALLAKALVADPDERLTVDKLVTELDRLAGAALRSELGARVTGVRLALESGDLKRPSDPWLIRLPASPAPPVPAAPEPIPVEQAPAPEQEFAPATAFEMPEPPGCSPAAANIIVDARASDDLDEAWLDSAPAQAAPVVEQVAERIQAAPAEPVSEPAELVPTPQLTEQVRAAVAVPPAEKSAPVAAVAPESPPAPSPPKVELGSEWPPAELSSAPRNRKIGLTLGAIVAALGVFAITRMTPSPDSIEDSTNAAKPAATPPVAHTARALQPVASAEDRRDPAAPGSAATSAEATKPSASKRRAASSAKSRKQTTSVRDSTAPTTRKSVSSKTAGSKPTEPKRRPKP